MHVCLSVCACSMDSQTDIDILMKLCKQDPWVLLWFFTKKNSENIIPGEGKRNLNFPFKKNFLKNHDSVVKVQVSQPGS